MKYGEGNSLARLLEEGAVSERELPYEKFERLGASALTDAELLAIIIRTGTSRLSPVRIGQMILNAGGTKEQGLSGLHHLSLEQLGAIPGIGRVKAIKLKCITELSLRIARERARPTLSFTEPAMVANYYMEQLRHEDRELVLVLSLNVRMCLIAESELSRGTVKSSLISPREVMLEALRHGAVNVMLLHNHPGGDPSPSRADREATMAVQKAADLMQIRLADHLIIGDGRYYSFCEQGELT